MPKFDIAAALADGYSYSEIASYLSELHGFDLNAAKYDGIGDEEVAGFLSAREVRPPVESDSDFGAGVKQLGRLAYDFPTQVQGAAGALMYDPLEPEGTGARWIDVADKRNRERAAQLELEGTAEKKFLPGISVGNVQDASRSTGFSAVAMGPSIAGEIGATLAAKAPNPAVKLGGQALSYLGGAAGSAIAGKNMDEAMFTKQLLERANQQMLSTDGRPMTNEETRKYLDETAEIRSQHGLWEAGPEAVGNALEVIGLRKIFSGLAKGNLLGAVAGLVMNQATEHTTETITGMGQQPLEVAGGLSNEKPYEMGNLQDWGAAFKEQAPVTAVLGGVTGGAAGAAGKLYGMTRPPLQATPEPERQMPDFEADRQQVESLQVPTPIIPPLKPTDFAGISAVPDALSAMRTQPTVTAKVDTATQQVENATTPNGYGNPLDTAGEIITAVRGADEAKLAELEKAIEAPELDDFAAAIRGDIADRREELAKRPEILPADPLTELLSTISTADQPTLLQMADGLPGLVEGSPELAPYQRQLSDAISKRQRILWEESNVGRGKVSGDQGGVAARGEQVASSDGTGQLSEVSARGYRTGDANPVHGAGVEGLDDRDQGATGGRVAPEGVGEKRAGVEQASPLLTAARQHVAETGDMTMGGLMKALDVDIDTAEALLEQVKATTPLPRSIGATAPATVGADTGGFLNDQAIRKAVAKSLATTAGDAQGFIADQGVRKATGTATAAPTADAGGFVRDQQVRREAMGRVDKPTRREGENARAFLERKREWEKGTVEPFAEEMFSAANKITGGGAANPFVLSKKGQVEVMSRAAKEIDPRLNTDERFHDALTSVGAVGRLPVRSANRKLASAFSSILSYRLDPESSRLEMAAALRGDEDEMARLVDKNALVRMRRNEDNSEDYELTSLGKKLLARFGEIGAVALAEKNISVSSRAENETQAELPRTDETQAGAGKGVTAPSPGEAGTGFDPLALLTGKGGKPSAEEPARNQHLKRVQELLADTEREINDWATRRYKDNKKTVTVGGDVDSLNASDMEIGRINESRRKRTIEALVRRRKDLEAARDSLESDPESVGDIAADLKAEYGIDLAAQPSASKATPEKPAGVATSGQRQEQAAKEPWQMTREEYIADLNERTKQAEAAEIMALKAASVERKPGLKTRALQIARKDLAGWRGALEDKGNEHKAAVSQALADRIPVPASVLADYPELADTKPRKDADMDDVAETDFGNMEQPAQPAQAEAASGERGDSFARENVRKNHYIKRKQPGLGDRKVPWELVSTVSAEGVMVDNKTFVVPFDQITDIRTGMPDLGRGEVIFKDGAPVVRKVSAQSPSEKHEETASSEVGGEVVSPNEDNGYQKITKAEFEKRPDVLFHGTDREIVSFDTEQDMRFGVHFGTRETASSVPESTGKDRSKFRLIPAILDVKNPLLLPDLEFWQPKDIASELDKLGITYKKRAHLGAEYTTHKDLIAAIKKAGYDGVVYDNKFEGGGDSTIVFDDVQILTYERFVGTDGSQKTTIADFGEKIGGARKEAGIVEHTTKRGKVLRGRIVTGISYRQAKEADPYTFKKDGGFFIREGAGEVKKDDAPAEAKETAPEKGEAQPKENLAIKRLRISAERLKAAGEAKLNQDRNVNTARRARMANNAEADARADIRTAETLLNIVNAQEDGTAGALAGLTSKAQLETLQGILTQAKYAEERKKENGKQDHARPANKDDIKSAVYLYPHFYDYKDLDALIDLLGNKKGWRTKRNDLRRGGLVVNGKERIEMLREALKLAGDDYRFRTVGEQLRGYDRLQKAGITDDLALREALERLVELSGKAPEKNRAQELERALVGQNTGIDFFPTPKAQAKFIVDRAGIEPGMRVLEPSAGTGNLAEEMRAQGGEVEVAEISPAHREVLEAKGFKIVEHDFMDMEEGGYDVIVMNPPFSNNMDIDHVRKAYELLKPGGRVVAIMGEGAFFRTGKKETEFREWLDEVGINEELPEGFFTDKKELRTTGVNARVVEIDKPDVSEDGRPVESNYKSAREYLAALLQWREETGNANEYEQRREDRADRIEARADKLNSEAAAAFERSAKIGERFHGGQPILVGHHSEKSARAAQAKMHSAMDKSVDLGKQADEAAYRAEAARRNKAISSDDEDAIVKLKAKIEAAEELQAQYKAINKAIRKKDTVKGDEELAALGLSEKSIAELRSPTEHWREPGVPSYRLQNNNANIRRMKQRLESLERNRQDETQEFEFDGGKIIDNVEDNRVQIDFDAKPSAELREALKGSAFAWAPSVSMWQRKRGGNALYAAKRIVGLTDDGPKLSTTALPPSSRADIQGELTQAFGKLRARVLMRKITVLESQEEAKALVARLGGKLSAAWHGSPHEFDEFRMSAVGTGEGAQAYGYGLYFASKRGVAEHYKTVLSAKRKQIRIKGVETKFQGNFSYTDMLVSRLLEGEDFETARERIVRIAEADLADLEKYGAQESESDWNSDDAAGYSEDYAVLTDELEELRALSKDDVEVENPSGRLYKVELAPQEDEYLLWDRPLSEQSEKVREALGAVIENTPGGGRYKDDLFLSRPSKSGGSEYSAEGFVFYKSLANRLGKREASGYLHSLGIRGIKYLDGSSRSKGEGAYNYVIFDEKDVEITAKYSKNGAIQGIYANGKTYLVADGIAKNQAVPVLLHELGEHAAQLGFAGDSEYQGILRSLEKRAEAQNATGKAIRAAMARVPEDTLPEHYWSEVAAYLVENKANGEIGIVKRILNFFKRWLYKAGAINADRLTPEDLVLFARSATLAHTGATYGDGVRQSLREMFKPVDTESAAFKRWFGDSKVVDSDGKPLVVYHGTDAEFEAFDTSDKSLSQAAKNYLGENIGSFFSSKKGDAKGFGKVGAYYLTLRTPKRFKTQAEFREFMREHSGRTADIRDEEGFILEEGRFENNMRAAIEAEGYDGVIIESPQYSSKKGGPWFIAFNPTQIKSATENTGEFSPTDPRFRYSKRFEAGEAEIVERVTNKYDIFPGARAFLTPEYTLVRDPAGKRAFDAARKRATNKHEFGNWILDGTTPRDAWDEESQGDYADHYTGTNQTFLNAMNALDEAEYKQTNGYLTDADKPGAKPFRVRHIKGFEVRTPDGTFVGFAKDKPATYDLKSRHHRMNHGEKSDVLMVDYKTDPIDKWIVFDGRTPVGRFDEEAKAIQAMMDKEGEKLAGKGFSEKSVGAVRVWREMTNRAFDLEVSELRKIEAQRAAMGLPPLEFDMVDETKRWAIKDKQGNLVATYEFKEDAELHLRELAKYKAGFAHVKITRQSDSEIMGTGSIHDYISMLGDLRGSYFPRQRPSGGIVLTATNADGRKVREHFDLWISKGRKYDGTNADENALLKFARGNFNALTPLGRRIRALEKEGFKREDIVVEKAHPMPEEVYDVTGLASAINALMDESLQNVKDKSKASPKLESAFAELHKAMAANLANIFKERGGLSSRIRRNPTDYWEGFETDMKKAGVQYARRMAATIAKRQAAQEITLALTGRDISFDEFKAKKLGTTWEEYAEFVNKRKLDPKTQPNLYGEAMSWTKEVLRNDEQVDRIIGTLRGLATLKFLGLRVSSAAVNLTNLLTGVPATISHYSGGAIPSAVRQVTRSLKALADYKRGKSSGLDKRVITEIKERGLDVALFNNEAMGVLRSKVGNAGAFVSDKMMGMFGFTERINRGATIHAAYMELHRKHPDMTHAQLMEKAEIVSNRAHGLYGDLTAPMWTRGSGNPLRMTFTFMKFSQNYMMNMGDMVRKKDYKNAAYLLLSPAILGGLGASAATPVIMGIARALGMGDDPEEELYTWAAEVFGSDTVMRHGLPGLLGVNFKGSLAVNNPVPTTIEELFGAPGSLFFDIRDAVRETRRGAYGKAAEKFFPTGVVAPFKALREYDEGVTTGSYSRVHYGNEPLKATGYDAVLRAFSFNPSRISGIREKQWSEDKIARKYRQERTDINTKVKKAWLKGNGKISHADWLELMAEVESYNERVKGLNLPDITPITKKALRLLLRRQGKPNKRERLRTNPNI